MTSNNKYNYDNYSRRAVWIEKSVLKLANKYDINVTAASRIGIMNAIKKSKQYYHKQKPVEVKDTIDLEIQEELKEAEEK